MPLSAKIIAPIAKTRLSCLPIRKPPHEYEVVIGTLPPRPASSRRRSLEFGAVMPPWRLIVVATVIGAPAAGPRARRNVAGVRAGYQAALLVAARPRPDKAAHLKFVRRVQSRQRSRPQAAHGILAKHEFARGQHCRDPIRAGRPYYHAAMLRRRRNRAEAAHRAAYGTSACAANAAHQSLQGFHDQHLDDLALPDLSWPEPPFKVPGLGCNPPQPLLELRDLGGSRFVAAQRFGLRGQRLGH